eukprot:scaffold1645_cov288-Pavlova_lutheri.AAC.1
MVRTRWGIFRDKDGKASPLKGPRPPMNPPGSQPFSDSQVFLFAASRGTSSRFLPLYEALSSVVHPFKVHPLLAWT